MDKAEEICELLENEINATSPMIVDVPTLATKGKMVMIEDDRAVATGAQIDVAPSVE
jgi:hypothetical protein